MTVSVETELSDALLTEYTIKEEGKYMLPVALFDEKQYRKQQH